MGSKFSDGDRVTLRSGGPDMTVRGLHFDVFSNVLREDMYDCVWFERTDDGRHEVHYCPFYEHELSILNIDKEKRSQ